MKKIVSAAGLAALGAVGLQAAAGDGLSRIEASKPWSIKANLRGFYDDNVFTTPDDFKTPYLNAEGGYVLDKDGNPEYRSVDPVSSYGIEFRPSAKLNLVTDQTILSAGYEYGLRWYEDRPGTSADQSHIANLSVSHDLDANTSISLGDTFTLAQEPDVLDSATRIRSVEQNKLVKDVEDTANTSFRNNLDNINNNLFFSLNRQLTESVSANLGYQFDIYRYADDSTGGFAARLDRNHHRFDLSLSRQISDSTSVLLGYQFRNVGFTSSEMLGERYWGADFALDVDGLEDWEEDIVDPETGETVKRVPENAKNLNGARFNIYNENDESNFFDQIAVGEAYGIRPVDGDGNPIDDNDKVRSYRKSYYRFDPDSRNTDTHYLFVGVNHLFTPELQASARVGAQFVRYTGVEDANPFNPDDSTVSPYVDANLSYAYAEGSTVSGGIRHERNQTDLALLGAVGSGGQAMDQEATTIYASINHRLTSRITLNATGIYSMSRFDDHVAWLGNDDYLGLGLNGSYYINQHLSADLGYNFDDLDSAVGQRSFTRNRVYVGLKASY